VHKDSYDDTKLDTEVENYDRRRARTNPYRKQRNPERYGTKDDYGWSDDKARQTATAERLAFAAYVRRSGFDI